MKTHFFIDTSFWAMFPAFNLNFHSWSLEFEFLCFGLYVDFLKNRQIYTYQYKEPTGALYKLSSSDPKTLELIEDEDVS